MIIKTYTLAIDFDGTLVEDRYPKIGKPILFAFDTLKKLQENGILDKPTKSKESIWNFGKTIEQI